jgi:hypothetical protein
MKLLLCLILCERLDVLLRKTSRVRRVRDQKFPTTSRSNPSPRDFCEAWLMADDYLSKKSRIHGSRSQISL